MDSMNTDTIKEYNGITIDYSRDKLLTEKAVSMLTKRGFYKKEHEGSPQETFARAASCYCFGDYDFAQRIYDYASLGWFTFASPVLSNAVDITWPDFTEEQFEEAAEWLESHIIPEGMPISCFLGLIPDTKEGLVQARSETEWLSMMGGGISIHPTMRSPDEKSTGVMAHLKGYDADALSYKQTESRRGSIAAYMEIDHPEIKSFLQMRNPVGGDINKKCFNLNNAVNIPDWFMHKVLLGENYELIDPKHGYTGRYLNAREVWEEVLELRYETGEPYIFFTDTVNRGIPDWIMNPLYTVNQSNLCTEITLRTTQNRTAVCCLSSLNLAKMDEWKDTQIVEDVITMLDNVIEYFIRLAPSTLQRAIHSASKERAIGLGTLGYHSYMQSKMIPFESGGLNSASQITDMIYSKIKKRAVEQSLKLGRLRGEPSDCFGSGMRNSHLLAIAPNASSADMVGESPSIEPWSSNCFNSQGRAGSYLVKNKYLERLLDDKGQNTDEIWESIMENSGSVQHLGFLTSEEKAVFKTAREINPQWVIELAAIRQEHICQAQSINLFLPEDCSKQLMSDIHFLAWKKGVKTLYYCRAKAKKKASIGKSIQKPLNAVTHEIDFDECLSCQG